MTHPLLTCPSTIEKGSAPVRLELRGVERRGMRYGHGYNKGQGKDTSTYNEKKLIMIHANM